MAPIFKGAVGIVFDKSPVIYRRMLIEQALAVENVLLASSA
jgi:hypothetical protein